MPIIRDSVRRAGDLMTGALIVAVDGATTPIDSISRVAVSQETWGGFESVSYNDADQYPTFIGAKAGGTRASPALVTDGHNLFMFFARGYDGAAWRNAGIIRFQVDGTPASSDMPGRITFATTLDGGISTTERLRIKNSGEISHRNNATVVIDANSHLGLRSYTVATLPSATTAALMIYVSNGTSSKRLAVSNGMNWRFPDGAIVS